jgi:hypothetical protein
MLHKDMEGDAKEESSKEEEDEFEPPPDGSLQAALLSSFESAHAESSTMVVHAIVLE